MISSVGMASNHKVESSVTVEHLAFSPGSIKLNLMVDLVVCDPIYGRIDVEFIVVDLSSALS